MKNLLLLSIFNIFVFSKNPSAFLRKKMNVLKNFKISVAFCDNFAIFSDFQKFMIFLEKLSYFFFVKNKIWTFRELFFIPLLSTTNFLFLRFLKYCFFFKKSISFYEKMNVLRKRNVSVAFYDNFAIFRDFDEFMFCLEDII